MMEEFEKVQWWNNTTLQYQDALIKRTFNNGGVTITPIRWL